MSSPSVRSVSEGQQSQRFLMAHAPSPSSSSSPKVVVPTATGASARHTRFDSGDTSSLRLPPGTFNYEPLRQRSNDTSTSDPPSWAISNTPSSIFIQGQNFPQAYVRVANDEQDQASASGIAPHVDNVPGLIRRGSSRRRVVVKRAPSIKSERNRYSVISEETYTSKRKNSIGRVNRYGIYVPKRKLFNFLPFNLRKDSIKYKYKHKDALSALFENSAELQQNEIYTRSKRNPLVLQLFEIPPLEKLKSNPRLRAKLKIAHFDLHHEMDLEDATSDIIDLYFTDYATPKLKPTNNKNQGTEPTASHTAFKPKVAENSESVSSNSTTERDYVNFKNQFFKSKTKNSRDLFEIKDNVPDEFVKRLALTIYLRRLMAAKVLLRMNLENSSSSNYSLNQLVLSSEVSVSTESSSILYRLPVFTHRDSSYVSQNSLTSSRLENLVTLSIPSSSASRLTFHSFK